MPFHYKYGNPTVYPSALEIKAVSDPYNYVNVGIVEDAVTYVYLDADRGYMSRPINADKLAASQVDDFFTSIMYAEPESEKEDVFSMHPGLFWLPGELTAKQVEDKYPERLKKIRREQDIWFTRIVEVADDEWARAKHHRAISPVQKLAAECLGLTREWVIQSQKQQEVTFSKCPACRTLVDSEAVICAICHCVLNAEGYAKLQFTTKQLPKPAA